MIKVRDKNNPERLLGHLTERPLANLDGRMMCMPIYNRATALRCLYGEPVMDLDVSCVMFDVSFRTIDGGYTRVAEFHTSSPLKDLVNIRTFRLPHEDVREMRERQFRSYL